MPSIVVSSDDRELSESIAERAAGKLGYELVGPSILASVASRHDLSEETLRRVLDAATYRKVARPKRALALACIQAATLERMEPDNVVCAGLAAHLYVREVSHVLMIRVLADTRVLVNTLVNEKKVSQRRAEKLLERERERRSAWSTDYFSLDEDNASLYDMVFRVGQIAPEKIVESIADMAGHRNFRANSYSRKSLGDLASAARARVALLPRHPEIRVRADGDKVIVHVKCPKRQRQQCAGEVKEAVRRSSRVKLVEVHTVASLRQLQ